MANSRSVVGPLMILALLGLSAVLYARLNVNSFAKQHVENKLDQLFAGTGFGATVRKVNFIDGTGLELRGFRLYDQVQGRRQLVAIDSLLVRFSTQIKDLVLDKVNPDAIDIHGGQFFVSQDQIDDEFSRRIKVVLERKQRMHPPVPVRIRESTLSLTASGAKRSVELSRFDIDLLPKNDEKSLIRFNCKASGNQVRQFNATGSIDLVRKKWNATIEQAVFSIDESSNELLPNSIELESFPLAGIGGIVAISGAAESTFDLGVVRFSAKGRTNDLSVENDSQPYSIEDCEINFSVNNEGFRISRAKGRIGAGDFDVKYQQRGLTKRLAWKTSGTINGFEFNSKHSSRLPGHLQKFCHDFSPSGNFDVKFKADSKGNKDISAQLTDMSFSFHKFPYEIEHCVGNVNWENDRLDFSVQALQQQQLVEFNGRVLNPGLGATYVFEFGTDGRIPIDHKLLNSLKNYPAMDKACRDLRPNGFVSGQGTVKKLTPHSTVVQREIQIQLHDCSIRHKKFDYPVHAVAGRVQVTNDGFSFDEISGRNSSGQTMCNGTWNERDGLRLVFNGNSIQLDNRLRNALSANLQDVWDGFRPSGRVAFGKVFLDYPPGAPFADVRIQANLGGPYDDSPTQNSSDSVSINPEWFPYRIENLKGDIRIGGGIVTLEKILGKHGRTWMSCSGNGRYSESDWSISLTNLLAGAVRPEQDLLQALPTNLADAIRQLDYEGQVNLSGLISFAGVHANDRSMANAGYESIRQVSYENQTYPVDVGWDLRLDIDQGAMLVGLPLENIFGSVRLKGKSKGDISECVGEVALDSLTIYDMQVTNVQGPIWIDNNQTLAGRFANSDDEESPSLEGNVYDGKISFDGWVSHENKFPFFIQTVVEKSQLSELASEVAPGLLELSGDCYGHLRLNGNANELHTYTGEGNVHLRNAKIHELPIVLSLLKILSIKELTRTAFDSSNIDFTIDGNQVKFDRIELIGDAISLIGNGYMELWRHADVNFYSVVGRNRFYIPLISELYKAGSQRIMWINISGPLHDLRTSRKMLPGLDDSLKQLLRPSENSNQVGRRPDN